MMLEPPQEEEEEEEEMPMVEEDNPFKSGTIIFTKIFLCVNEFTFYPARTQTFISWLFNVH